jgi:peptidoglycan hydrolase-like protein with peptidoglycan-binding domain
MALVSPRFANSRRLQAASENSPPMRKGETGEAVQNLQQALIDVGFPMPVSTKAGSPDGIYGDETVNTVYRFQAREGLQRDGIAGHDTFHRLDDLLSDGDDPPLTGPPRIVNSRPWTYSTARRGEI